MNLNSKIDCPVCDWEPTPRDVWMCTDCETTWNTFDTQGLCPTCNKQWTHTQCLNCCHWLPHKEWYQGIHKPDLFTELRKRPFEERYIFISKRY